MPTGADAITSVGHSEDSFEVIRWDALGLWSWDMDVEQCAICRNHIMEDCIDCQDRDIKCSTAHGACNHVFHFCCITRWLQNRNTCPLGMLLHISLLILTIDNLEWEFKTLQSQ